VLFSLALALIVAVFLLVYGKDESFLIINEHNNSGLDYFFEAWTYLGNGFIWVPLFLYIIFFRRNYFVTALAGLIICTIITQFLKHVVFPNNFRPIVLLPNKLRAIQGYFMNRTNSFPSGHTSTAFTLALLCAFIVKKKFWTYFFPLIAFFVGYSRVYLAQHFVTDVLAGIFIGIVSSYLALWITSVYSKKKLGDEEEHKSQITQIKTTDYTD